MKRITAFLLLAVLLLSLAACGQTSKVTDSTEQKPAESTPSITKPAPTETEAKPPVTEAPTTEAPETEAPETEAPETEAAGDDGNDVSIGSVEGSTYTNDTLGITCTVDDDWAYYDKANIAALNQLTVEMINDENVKDMINQGKSFMDAYAFSAVTGSNFNVTLQKVNVLATLLATEKDVLESAREQAVSALEASGFTDVEYSLGKKTFAGEEHDVAILHSVFQGVELHQTIVCILKNGYCGSITVTCVGTEETDKILGFFSEID